MSFTLELWVLLLRCWQRASCRVVHATSPPPSRLPSPPPRSAKLAFMVRATGSGSRGQGAEVWYGRCQGLEGGDDRKPCLSAPSPLRGCLMHVMSMHHLLRVRRTCKVEEGIRRRCWRWLRRRGVVLRLCVRHGRRDVVLHMRRHARASDMGGPRGVGHGDALVFADGRCSRKRFVCW